MSKDKEIIEIGSLVRYDRNNRWLPDGMLGLISKVLVTDRPIEKHAVLWGTKVYVILWNDGTTTDEFESDIELCSR